MIKKFFKIFFSIVALIATIGVPIVAVHDAIHPWSVAAKSLEQERPNFLTFAVGVAATGSTINQKLYALIPKGFHAPTILVVNQTGEGQITTEKEPFSFWFMTGFIIYGIYVLKQLKHWIVARWKKVRVANAR